LITKTIHESGNLIIACFSGVVTMQEIEEYFYWLVNTHGKGIKDNFSQLIYSSDLEKVDVQVADVHRISHLRATVGRSSSGSRLALVVPDLKYYWMAKLYQTLSKSSQINTRLFRDIDESFEWLGFENLLTK
jgi:hypothetical protein